jgi:uncharacterized membrane protein YoaK (UPF0700 family)
VRRLDDEDLREVLLVALTTSAGAVDAISYLALGKLFSAFQTGNIVFLGFKLAGAAGPSTLRVIAALAGFALGAFLGARIVAPTAVGGAVWPQRVTVALAAGAVAQAVFCIVWLAVDGRPSSGAGDALIAISAVAMGLQTASVFSLGLRAIFTTAATATWTALMGDLTSWSRTRGERHRLAAILVALIGGAVVGTLLLDHARAWAALFPLIMTVAVVAVAARRLHPAGSHQLPRAHVVND